MRSANVLALVLLSGCAVASGGIPDRADDGDPPGGSDDPGQGPRDGDGDGNDPDPEPPACAQTLRLEVEVEAMPPDLLIVLDRSSSMGQSIAFDSLVRRWDIVRTALDGVLATHQERAHFGLMLVPHTREGFCVAGEVDIAPAAGGAVAVTSMLDETEPGGSSPTAPSLAKARAHFEAAPANPYGRYVVLTSDGEPNCGLNAIADTAGQIAALRADGVKTFVLGYATDAPIARLDDFAEAGGTGAHLPAATPDAMVAALESIAEQVTTVACSYRLDDGPAVATSLTVKMGGDLVPYSPEHEDGWDYEGSDRTLTFYGAACEALRDPSVGAVEASYCQSVD